MIKQPRPAPADAASDPPPPDALAVLALGVQQSQLVRTTKARLARDVIALGGTLARIQHEQLYRQAGYPSFLAWVGAALHIQDDMARLYIQAGRVQADWLGDAALGVRTLARIGRAPAALRPVLAAHVSESTRQGLLNAAASEGEQRLAAGQDSGQVCAHVQAVLRGQAPPRDEEGGSLPQPWKKLSRRLRSLRKLIAALAGSAPALASAERAQASAECALLIKHLAPLLAASGPTGAPNTFGGSGPPEGPNAFGGSGSPEGPNAFGGSGPPEGPNAFGGSGPPEDPNAFGAHPSAAPRPGERRPTPRTTVARPRWDDDLDDTRDDVHGHLADQHEDAAPHPAAAWPRAPAVLAQVTVEHIGAALKAQLSADDQRALCDLMYTALKGKHPSVTFDEPIAALGAKIDEAAARFPGGTMKRWHEVACHRQRHLRFLPLWQTFLAAQLPDWRRRLHALHAAPDANLSAEQRALVSAAARRVPLVTDAELAALRAQVIVTPQWRQRYWHDVDRGHTAPAHVHSR